MTVAIGLLGGTFDPVHFAHLRLAVEAAEQLHLDSVRWIPSGQPGHRGAPAAGVEHRLAMLRLAISDEPRFTLDEADARSAAPTFTVESLARLRTELGAKVPLVLIIGTDQLLALDTWREW
ncbi:MAG: nicotinate-nicotinamide nucleotide adenylyltransferase, partial [Betaproteobacteria bacterium]|nr:nicotinate-nicotinamide nucleotide adenylyltransferase [Betaproteobacteria bacterium]